MSLFGKPAAPSLEERRFAQETAARERELNLREREVSAREVELKRSRWTSPMVLGLFAAAIGLAGNIVVALVNNSNTQEVQRLQAEANITLTAIKTGTGNTDDACKNLIFFVSLGLVRDPEGKIGKTCKGAPAGPPSLPTSSLAPASSFSGAVIDTFLFKGRVVDSVGNGIVGALVTVNPTGMPASVLPGMSAAYIFSDKDGRFSSGLPSWWEASTLSVHVTCLGYSETTVQVPATLKVPANRDVLITLHQLPSPF
jgi:hypothetical protein